jgi:hypothetical protein
MSEYIAINHNVETNEITEKVMTTKQIKELQTIQEETTNTENAQKALKVSAYTKLGLTEEEINAIL